MYMSDDKPIGWWVKQLDRTLEQSLDAALAGQGLTRREWQLLSLAARGGTTAELAPFLDRAAADALVDVLAGRGWVRTDAGALVLTEQGAAVRDRATTEVQAQRRRSMTGIEPAEYAATVDVLRRMAANLAPAAG